MGANCEVCGKPIHSTRKGVRFCSSGCRVKAYRKRQKEAEEARRRTVPIDLYPRLYWLRENLPQAADKVEKAIFEHGVGCAEAVLEVAMIAAAEFGAKVAE